MTEIKEDESLQSELRKFAKWAKKIGRNGLVKCSSGNLSKRYKNNLLLVSESKCWLEDLKANQVVTLNIETGSIIEGNNPTGELPLHLETMRRNPAAETILHCQSEAATALACSKIPVDYNVIIEVPVYLGEITHIPFIMPGSLELAGAVAEASLTSGVIQLQNHGQVIIGSGYKDVFQKAVFFELACRIILQNHHHSVLTSDDIKKLKGYR